MASEEELRREEELLRLTRERVGINSDILQDVRDISNVLNDQVRQLSFEKRERTEIRNITKETSKIASESYNITINEIGTQKQLAKLAKDKGTLTKELISLKELESQFSNGTSKLEKEIGQSLKDQIQFTQNLLIGLEEVEQVSQAISENVSVQRFRGISSFISSIPGLKKFAEPFKTASNNIAQAVTQNELLKKETEELFKTGKGLNREKIKELGLTTELKGLEGTAAAQRAKKLGLDKKITSEAKIQTIVAQEYTKILSDLATITIGAKLLTSLFQVNKAQTEFRRLTGQSISTVETLTASLITTVDVINQASSATQQLGLNAAALFDNINLKEAAELTNLLGLSSEEANNLALASQSTGQNLSIGVENAIAQVNAVNATRKSAVSQKVVFQDIANISSGLTVAFNGQVDLLAQAAAEARALGLNLSQVDKIANNLLDIENSIRKEFEAETILATNLNLDRARFFAQTDNIVGLVKELRNNEGLIEGFIRGGRIEREAAAEAIGLSVEEMGKFVLLNQSSLGITQQEALAAANVSEAQLKQLTIQDSLNKSLEKLTQLMVGGLEPVVAGIANNFTLVATALGAIAGLSLSKLVLQLSAAAVQAGLIQGFLSPQKFLIAVGAITAGLALVGASAALYAKKQAQNVQDGIAPSEKGPFTITDKFGAMAVTAPGDSLFASPNISSQPVTPPEPKNITFDPVINVTPTPLPDIKVEVNPNILLDSIKSDISNLVPPTIITPNTEGNNLLKDIRDNISNLTIPQPSVNVTSLVENTEGNNLLRDIKNNINNISITLPLSPNIDISPIVENTEGNNLLKDIRNNIKNISLPLSTPPNINISPIVENPEGNNLLRDIRNNINVSSIVENTEGNNLLRDIRNNIKNISPPQPTPSNVSVSPVVENTEGNNLLRDIRNKILNFVFPQPNITVSPIVNESTKVVSLLEEIKKGISSIFIPETNVTLPSFPPVIAENTEGNSILRSIENSLTSLLPPQIIINPTITPQVIEKEPTIPAPLNVTNTTIVREDRNINTTVTLSEKDIRAIANAVREGAMEGTSKANVQAVIPNRTVSQLSTRIQPELAVNTYRSAY